MTLKEALESGRRFKRPVHEAYMLLTSNTVVFACAYGETKLTRYALTPDDVLATDWEVEPKKVTKEVVRYVNVYPYGLSSRGYSTEAEAKINAGEGSTDVVKLTGTYEVEE